MQNIVVSAPYATEEQKAAIQSALIALGAEESSLEVSTKTVAILSMEEEVYMQAESNGYKIEGNEEKLDKIAYEIVMEDEWLMEKTSEAITEALSNSDVPLAEDEESANESDGDDPATYLGVTSDKTYPLTRTQIPHFIMLFGQNEGLRIVDALDQIVLTTLPGPFLDRVFDSELHQELLKTLIPMQQGDVQPTNFWADEEE